MIKPFSKILIANRGEIACRIIRTARGMGYHTVAIVSDVDREARHAAMADEAFAIGGSTAAESYLDIAKVLAAATATGADAIHPGYGFLSENADFAAACVAAGLVFIGPSASAIAAMGNKAAAKRLMIEAGVPCVPGYQGADQSDARLEKEVAAIGLPVMIKAAAGGGGRGMRLVTVARDIASQIQGARREAEAAFGSGELILEKAVVGARHIEIQVFGDTHGDVLHLGERDCSIQRRHQKVIEEAPSPAVGADLRAKMGAAAVAAARAIKYSGAGTIEFLLDATGQFYFLEMNTRIQVEHPVTEAVTDVDLVRWQIDVAAGGRLPVSQDGVSIKGHAIEARLYAEDPHAGFLPRSGRIVAWSFPKSRGLRVDHGLAIAPTAVSPFYDPMIAKIIARGATREEARRRLLLALEETHVHGITTNRAFLLAALRQSAFVAGEATTAFIGAHFAPSSVGLARPVPDAAMLALAAALVVAKGGGRSGWRSTGPRAVPLKLKTGNAVHECRVTQISADHYAVTGGDGGHDISLLGEHEGRVRFSCGDHTRWADVAWDGALLLIDLGDVSLSVEDVTLASRSAAEGEGGAQLRAPMNGRIVVVEAKSGDVVRKGQRLIVLEAMKMQHEIAAERDGTVDAVPVKPGDQVATRQVLLTLLG